MRQLAGTTSLPAHDIKILNITNKALIALALCAEREGTAFSTVSVPLCRSPKNFNCTNI